MTSIGHELKLFRKGFGLTQQEAAELLATSATSLGRFERGDRTPPYREIQRLRAMMDAVEGGASLHRDGRVW